MTSKAIEVHSLIFSPYQTAATAQNSINTYDEWLLLPSKKPVLALPPVRTNFVEVLGMNGVYDASGILDTTNHNPTYGMREGSIEFYIEDYKTNMTFESTKRAIANYLHGKQVTVSLASDQGVYYDGRWEIDEMHTDENWSMITLKYYLDSHGWYMSSGTKHSTL